MKELKFYLCRHGESVFNVENRLGGDSGLTGLGHAQAEALGDFLKDKYLDMIYVSNLKRTMQTAEIIKKYLSSAEFIVIPELSEIRYGLLDGLTVSEAKGNFPEEYAKRVKDKYRSKPREGESYADLLLRIKPFLNELCKKKGNYGIIGHKAVNKIILSQFSNLPLQEVLNMEFAHEHIFEISYQSVREISLEESI